MEVKPGYKQTEVGVIPEDWQLRPFMSTVKVASGQVDPKIEPYHSMILIAPDHIESGSGRLLKKETAGDQHAISGKYLFEPGDIVYSKIRPYLKKAILADFKGLCSADMYPLKPVTDVSAGFVFAVILGYHFSKYAESVSVRSGIPKINRDELSEYTIALPPIKAEQEAIAEALNNADTLIESLEQLIIKKQHVKQGVMQKLLPGKKRLPGFEIKPGYKNTVLGVIPEDWEVHRLKDLLTQPATYGVVKAGIFQQQGIPMLRGGDIKDGWVNTDLPLITPEKNTEYQRTVLRSGDIVIALVGYPGETAVIPKVLVGANISRAVGLIRPNSSLYARFLVCYLNSSSGRSEFLKPGAGSAQMVVNLRDLNQLWVPMPPKEEQKAIAEVIQDMDTELAKLKAKLTKACQIKQGMMQELLTGRIRLI